ncbi:MAG: hypothetical protein HQM08_08075 [Candidatus Riflebacteria bacterium]|nr:hypothetical protein [Candidatus Riflebacteria bacterium]
MIQKPFVQSEVSKLDEAREKEYLQIKNALAAKKDLLESVVRDRFASPHPWKFMASDFLLNESNETIDLVFEHPVAEDPRFVLLHLSIPFLQIGQKFSLENKARQFQKQKKIALSRIKKAILLVKKPGEVISTSETRLHCPILELDVTKLLEIQKKSNRPEVSEKKFTENILNDLKEAIVKECLTTIAKRKNKYVRKGIWRWIEREISDLNVHFFLTILSCIYQGNTSEVLSRKFKNIEDFCEKSEKIIESIFSAESSLADEIVQNSERHKKALQRFLECFQQTPPFEYLKSLFLKEFRTLRDGAKARTAVFLTLKELLGRCGFVGEKEIQYPLEILDELGIFQGFMMGNYNELRVDNAIKKLRHLIPEIAWTTQDVYKLRDELAKMLSLQASEFNLNAFLPQTFSAKPSSPGKSENHHQKPEHHVNPNQKNPNVHHKNTHGKSNQSQPQSQAQAQHAPHISSHPRPRMENKPSFVESRVNVSEQPAGSIQKPLEQTASSEQPKPTEQPVPQSKAITQKPFIPHQIAKSETEAQAPFPRQERVSPSPVVQKKFPPFEELDESKHRYFEFFGGHDKLGEESALLALEMEKFLETRNSEDEKISIAKKKFEETIIFEPSDEPPPPLIPSKNGMPLKSVNRNTNQVKRPINKLKRRKKRDRPGGKFLEK